MFKIIIVFNAEHVSQTCSLQYMHSYLGNSEVSNTSLVYAAELHFVIVIVVLNIKNKEVFSISKKKQI